MIQCDKMWPTKQAHRHKYGLLVFFAISLIIYLFKYDDKMFAESEMFVNVMRLVRMEGL